MALIDDLLLLLTNPRTGKCAMTRSEAAMVLAGAALTELMLSGNVRVTEKGESLRKNRLIVDPEVPPPADPLLADLLGKIAAKNRALRPAATITAMTGSWGGSHLVKDVYARLVQAERLSDRQGSVLGLFTTHTYDRLDVEYETHLLKDIDAVLFEQATPSDQIASIIGLLSVGNRLIGVVDRDRGVDKRAVKAAAKTLVEQNWAVKAAKAAIEEAQSAAAAGASAGH